MNPRKKSSSAKGPHATIAMTVTTFCTPDPRNVLVEGRGLQQTDSQPGGGRRVRGCEQQAHDCDAERQEIHCPGTDGTQAQRRPGSTAAAHGEGPYRYHHESLDEDKAPRADFVAVDSVEGPGGEPEARHDEYQDTEDDRDRLDDVPGPPGYASRARVCVSCGV